MTALLSVLGSQPPAPNKSIDFSVDQLLALEILAAQHNRSLRFAGLSRKPLVIALDSTWSALVEAGLIRALEDSPWFELTNEGWAELEVRGRLTSTSVESQKTTTISAINVVQCVKCPVCGSPYTPMDGKPWFLTHDGKLHIACMKCDTLTTGRLTFTPDGAA